MYRLVRKISRIKLFTLGLLLLSVLSASLATAQTQVVSLSSFNVDISETSVSGLSSGGYMTVQFQVAYASIVKGVGIIAGGPYFCAQDSQETATSVCSCTGLVGCKPDQTATMVPKLIGITDHNASQGHIDATTHLGEDRIWMFSGTLDSTVPHPLMDALELYYKNYVGETQIAYETNVAAEHAMPTDFFGNTCEFKGVPFINDCRYDAAGELLNWIYGDLNPKNVGTLSGAFIEFDQSEFISNPESHGMWPTGWVYVPKSCQEGTPCKIHVVFHGCKQYPGATYSAGPAGQIGDTYVKNTGYNRWADTNNIIVLYPQANALITGTRLPRVNPFGCWDWWGYDDANYAKRSGRQLVAVKGMLDRLAGEIPPEPAAYCGSATNTEHVASGRAYTRFFFLYYAEGSGDFLGFGDSAQTTLKETSPGFFEKVDSCPRDRGTG